MTPTKSPVHHMTAIRSYRDGRPYDTEQIDAPTWADVETAIRRRRRGRCGVLGVLGPDVVLRDIEGPYRASWVRLLWIPSAFPRCGRGHRADSTARPLGTLGETTQFR